jgi:hypothetical protein
VGLVRQAPDRSANSFVPLGEPRPVHASHIGVEEWNKEASLFLERLAEHSCECGPLRRYRARAATHTIVPVYPYINAGNRIGISGNIRHAAQKEWCGAPALPSRILEQVLTPAAGRPAVVVVPNRLEIHNCLFNRHNPDIKAQIFDLAFYSRDSLQRTNELKKALVWCIQTQE